MAKSWFVLLYPGRILAQRSGDRGYENVKNVLMREHAGTRVALTAAGMTPHESGVRHRSPMPFTPRLIC